MYNPGGKISSLSRFLHQATWQLHRKAEYFKLGSDQPLRHDLHDLDRTVDIEEIYAVVLQTAPEKAPGPDGYIGAFFKKCWGIVKHDLVDAITETGLLESLKL
jgi:hypothetical protein